MKAIWKDQILAQSDSTVIVEGNHYFPINTVDMSFFEETDHTSVCPWKGTSSYYTISVNGERNENAAFYYPTPKDAANEIKDHMAFWKGVEVVQ